MAISKRQKEERPLPKNTLYDIGGDSFLYFTKTGEMIKSAYYDRGQRFELAVCLERFYLYVS